MENQNLIEKFCLDMQASGLSKARLSRYRYTLYPLSKKLNIPLDEAKEEHLKKLIIDLENSNKYKPVTLNDFKIILRIFYRWLYPQTDEKAYPNLVKWMQIRDKRADHKLPEELLTQEEIKKLIEVADMQDKALISLLYESGTRAGEFISIKLKSIRFDENGGIIIIPQGKTGMRRIRVSDSVPYLQDWINLSSPDADDYLFSTKDYNKNPLTQAVLTKRIKLLANKTNLKKRIYPHLFRHSRATFLANYLTDAQMKSYFGWTQSSQMASIYIHLSGSNIDEALLSKVYGVKQVKEEARLDLLKPKKCFYCGNISDATSKFCKTCKRPVDIQAKIEFEDKRLEMDSKLNKILEMMVDKLQKSGIDLSEIKKELQDEN